MSLVMSFAFGLAELHHLRAAPLATRQNEPEDACDQDKGDDNAEHRQQPVVFYRLIGELGKLGFVHRVDHLIGAGNGVVEGNFLSLVHPVDV